MLDKVGEEEMGIEEQLEGHNVSLVVSGLSQARSESSSLLEKSC